MHPLYCTRLLDALTSDSATLGHYYEKDHSPKRRPMYWIYYEKVPASPHCLTA